MDELIISCCPNCGYESRQPFQELVVRHMRVQCQRCFKSFNAKDHMIYTMPLTGTQNPKSSQDNQTQPLRTHQAQNSTNNSALFGAGSDIEIEILDLDEEVAIDETSTESQKKASNASVKRTPRLGSQKTHAKPNSPSPSASPLAGRSSAHRSPLEPVAKKTTPNEPLGAPQAVRPSKITPSNPGKKTELDDSKPTRLQAIQNPNFQARNIEFKENKRVALTTADAAGDDFRTRLPYDDSFDDVTLLDQYPMEKEKSSWTRWLVIIALVLLALFQVEYLWRDKLAQVTVLRPAIKKWCQIRECELQPLASPSVIDIIESRIQQKEGDQIELQFTLRNTTEYMVQLPVIEIHFSDTNDDLVANFHLFPEQYSQLITALTPNEQMNFKVRFKVTSPTPASSFEIRTVDNPENS